MFGDVCLHGSVAFALNFYRILYKKTYRKWMFIEMDKRQAQKPLRHADTYHTGLNNVEIENFQNSILQIIVVCNINKHDNLENRILRIFLID